MTTSDQRATTLRSTFTVDPFNLQTLLVHQRRKPKHLRKYEVFWVFDITENCTATTYRSRDNPLDLSNPHA